MKKILSVLTSFLCCIGISGTVPVYGSITMTDGTANEENITYSETAVSDSSDTATNSISSQASERTGTYYYDINDEYVTITDTNIKRIENIPEKIEDLPVKELGERAFFACINSASSITIPNNVETIGDECFMGVIGSGYTTYYLPHSIEYIGEYALGYTCYENYQEGCVVSEKIEKLFGVVIYGYSNTVAEEYATENGFTFIALDEPEVTTTASVATTETTATTVTTTSKSTTTTVTTTTTTPIATVVSGDVNGDNILNVRDAAFIAATLANGKSDTLPKMTDFNGDGIINVRDAAAIATMLANKNSMESWEYAYQSLINGKSSKTERSYSLIYIDEDGVPELIVTDLGDNRDGGVYTYKNGILNELEGISLRDNIDGYSEKSGNFVMKWLWLEKAGYNFYKLENGAIERIHEFVTILTAEGEAESFSVDGENVTEEEYNQLYEEYSKNFKDVTYCEYDEIQNQLN